MADPAPEVVNALVRLMKGALDYDVLSDEDLFALGRAARRGQLTLHEVAATLKQRGYTLAQIGEGMGATESAASRWMHRPTRPGRRRADEEPSPGPTEDPDHLGPGAGAP